MTKFRKKPIVVEAVSVRDIRCGFDRGPAGFLPKWILQARSNGILIVPADEFGVEIVKVRTLEGEMIGNQDDWIIRGIEGEIYPCKGTIFEASYEPV